MRITLFIFATITLFACSQKDNKKEIQYAGIQEMSIDSLGLEKIFADSSLSSISPAEMNFLAEKLPDTSLFAGLNLSYSKIDSLKKVGGYENYISKLDIGMIKDIRVFRVKTDTVSADKILTFWGIGYNSYEACPYSNAKVILVTINEKGKNTACHPVAYFYDWADAPFYENYIATAKISKEGQLEIVEEHISGGVDDNDKEYADNKTNTIIIKLWNIKV